MRQTLDLALVGNGAIGLLIDARATVVWGCFPRFDGDPTFCALLDERESGADRGVHAVDLVDFDHAEQTYEPNTAVLVTRLHDRAGGAVEVTDCVPRYYQFGRVFHPMTHVRVIRCLAGTPRIVIRLRPASGYGGAPTATTVGSSHVRFVLADLTLRLTTNASLTAILEERPIVVGEPITLLLGPDESAPSAVDEIGQRFIAETVRYWRDWVRNLGIPFEWQPAVIRAAIALQQNAYDDTGAIVAALTTSVPEAAGSERTWDYRYCWLRDGYFVVDALNRLGVTRTMERYVRFIVGVVANGGATLQPVYRISGDPALDESIVTTLPGYRGMGPVRVGNEASRQVQHDVYGAAILASTHAFFDERLIHRGDRMLFDRLEALGQRALAVFDQPDAGPWELRGATRVHTFSSVMCWAACDRLARIARRVGLGDRAAKWSEGAERIRRFIDEQCWSDRYQTFFGATRGDALDASLLLLADLGYLRADDPRFASTVRAIEVELKRGDFVFRYAEPDDFGHPHNAFLVCTFWYVHALAALNRRDEARELFERLLSCSNRVGLLSEHVDPRTGELWGNFVQTYSMVGLITAAMRLSLPWDTAY